MLYPQEENDIQIFLLTVKFSQLQHTVRKMASKFAISSIIHKSLENELQKMQNDVKKIKSDFPD